MMPALPFLGIFFAAAYIEIIVVLNNNYQFLSRALIVVVIAMCCWTIVYIFNRSEQHYLTFSLDEIGKYVPRGKELGVSKAFTMIHTFLPIVKDIMNCHQVPIGQIWNTFLRIVLVQKKKSC